MKVIRPTGMGNDDVRSNEEVMWDIIISVLVARAGGSIVIEPEEYAHLYDRYAGLSLYAKDGKITGMLLEQGAVKDPQSFVDSMIAEKSN